MLTNPHTGQLVRIALEYRDEWPVHQIGDRVGTIQGIGNTIMVKFAGGSEVIHVAARFLEPADKE